MKRSGSGTRSSQVFIKFLSSLQGLIKEDLMQTVILPWRIVRSESSKILSSTTIQTYTGYSRFDELSLQSCKRLERPAPP